MPNHWESSARPLFVKTVFVNGNRHAILFEKDPLLRYGNSAIKKISRPNSSLSFASDLSLITSQSQDSDSDSRIHKLRNINHSQRKDLSSELQNCLVKLKLNSGNLKNKDKFVEKAVYNSKEVKEIQITENINLKQKKSKGKSEKIWQKKHCEQLYQEPNKHKVTGRKSSTNNSCYVYNLENFKGKKNYCFVKITSQPSQFALNCSCENGLNESHYCDSLIKNNMVISATIHNLIMNPKENENFLKNTLNYVLPVSHSDIYWNDYLTRSCCSLSERVFQWLELVRRRKQKKEKLDLKDNSVLASHTERILSGKKFANEIKEKENFHKKDNKSVINNKTAGTSSEEEVEGVVVGELNVETLLSSKNLKDSFEDYPVEIKPSDKVHKKSGSQLQFIKQGNNENSFTTTTSNFSSVLKAPAESTPQTSVSELIKSPLKIQDLFLNCRLKESYSSINFSEKRVIDNCSRQKKENSTMTSINSWEKISNKKTVFVEKSDTFNKQLNCRIGGNVDEYADKRKEQTLTEEFTERNQKSINNLNIARTNALLIPNLSQEQQRNKKSPFQEEKIIWSSEKNTGRPQLHIFMPSILFKDQSDDGFSEYENFFDF